MKLVRVHNPRGLKATKRKVNKTMATKRKSNKRRRKVTVRVTNRKRRISRRRNPATVMARRSNPGAVARRSNPRRQRRGFGRRRNPSAASIGAMLKTAGYGAAGAIFTRVGSGLAQGFVPGAISGSPFIGPVLQAAIAVFAVGPLGSKFFGSAQGEAMKVGGLISAGLAAVDTFLPNAQGMLSNVIRVPVQVAPGAGGGAQVVIPGNGMGDVEELPLDAFAGLADVEELNPGFPDYY